MLNPVASIMGGENIVQLAYDGIDVGIEDVSYSVNLPNGVDQSYTIASTYFDYNHPMRMSFASRRATKSTLGRICFDPRLYQWSEQGTLTLNILSLDPALPPMIRPM